MVTKNSFLFILFSVLAIGLAACGGAASLTPVAQAAATENGTAVINEEAEDAYLPTVIYGVKVSVAPALMSSVLTC